MIHTASKQAQQYAFDCSGPGDSGYELPGYRMNLLTHAMTYTSPLEETRRALLLCVLYQYCFLSAALPASLSNG